MFGTDTLSADNSDVRLCFDASQKKNYQQILEGRKLISL